MKKIYLGIILFIFISSNSGCSAKVPVNKKKLHENTNISFRKGNRLDETTNQPALHLSNLSMINETFGWLLKENKVLRTVDGGKSWKDISPYSYPANESYADEPQTAPCFYNSDIAWISLRMNTQDKKLAIYHTIDGGKKWDRTYLPIKEDWENYGQYIYFINSLNGFILTISSPACGLMNKAIYKTNDGGESWSRIGDITDEIDSYPTGIMFRNDKEGWITSSNHGQNYILTFKTNDGGYNWHRENLEIITLYQSYYTNSYPPVFLDNQKKVGILPIEYVGDKSPFIIPYFTRDGGKSWSAIKIINNHSFFCFDFINENQWLAIDSIDNKLYETNTGGHDWEEVSQNELYKDIKTLDFITTQIGWATGDNTFIKTLDGGKSWNNAN